MPPASRGPFPRLHFRKPRHPPPTRRNASISAPSDPRKFGRRIRSEQVKARNETAPAPPPPPSPSPQSYPSGSSIPTLPTWRARQTARINHFLMPKYLRDRPYLRTWIFSFLITVPISGFILVHFPLEPRRVTGPSMRPTINPECTSDHDKTYRPTWVLVQKWGPNTYRDTQRRIAAGEKVRGKYDRGQLIVYATPHDPERVALKRIVALPGDTVIPLPGYPGTDGEPIIVPYNHLWVEGDINDRKKSVDSNYFGPISQHLVKGKVLALWSPWWNIFSIHAADDKTYTWPARQQARVNENAVQSAQADPNKIDSVRPFERALGERTLHLLRSNPLHIEHHFFTSEAYRSQVLRTYQRGKQIARNYHDPETRERARDILKELERVIGRDALREAANPRGENGKPLKRWTPEVQAEEENGDWDGDVEKAVVFVRVVPREDEREVERRARTNPAKAALREVLQSKRHYGEMVDKEFAERDKVREAREL